MEQETHHNKTKIPVIAVSFNHLALLLFNSISSGLELVMTSKLLLMESGSSSIDEANRCGNGRGDGEGEMEFALMDGYG